MGQYILRLDDASDYMDLQKWTRMEKLLDKYDIKPIYGIIPEDIEFYCVGKDLLKLNRLAKQIVKRAGADNAQVIFHIHEAKSVVLFNLATGGAYRNKIVYTLHST